MQQLSKVISSTYDLVGLLFKYFNIPYKKTLYIKKFDVANEYTTLM